MNPQLFGLQNVFNELDQCSQPRFVHARLAQNVPARNFSDTIDLSSLIQQSRIDHIQGIIVKCRPRRVFSGSATNPNIETNGYVFNLDFGNGFFLTQDYESFDGTMPMAIDVSMPVLATNPPQILLDVSALDFSSAPTIGYLAMDIYLTNFVVRPFVNKFNWPKSGV